MRIAANFVVSLAALGALLGAATSQATNVAELPLKASVLAKPNVIFAMDESGSMDMEVMIDGTFQGYLWGSYQEALYPGGTRRTGSGTWDWPLYYLFPNGTGAGNRVYGDPNPAYGHGIPPIPELAWARSADYNSIYYDSSKTYKPWSPGYVSGSAATTFSDAASTAARSHPVNGSTTMSLTANLTSNSSNWKFTFLVGMTIPTGATDVQCYFNTFPGGLPYTVTSSRGLCTAALTYYPATFWRKETCTVDGTSCVTNYDGFTLKRYEIKSGNTFPSGRSFADEIQNFSNWFSYYRKRRLMLGSAMGQVLENISGLRMGVVPFNNNVSPTMYDADSTSASTNRLAVTGRFYTAEGSGGTPTHTTMAYIRDQFDTNTSIIQYACQRNSSFIITDGFANDGSVTPPSYSQTTYGATTPYQSIASGSLADKALAYFTLRLRASGGSALPAGKVPLGNQSVQNPDPNPDLHLTTYAVTLGMKGTVWPTSTNPFTSPPTWPTPASNTATMIDDLWHATINGRGQMYLATDATATADAIRSGLLDILSQTGAQGGVAVSTVNLQRGDSKAYFGTYNPSGWTGDLTANPINTGTGEVTTTPTWSAGSILLARDWTTRVIASHDGTSGVGFTATAVGSLVNPSNAWGVTSEVMDYLRGARTYEGTKFRTRTSLLGAVINSEPAVSRDEGVAYVASGEGMLHAIDTRDDPGKELWAYVPRAVLPDIGQTTSRSYTFKTQLDGSPVVARDSSTTKLLVAGMGAAGRSYYAIDVTNPRGLNETSLAAKVKWEFPTVSDTTTQAKMGQTVGRPSIVVVQGSGYRVLVTSGYNTGDGKGRLWMLNPSNGSIDQEFVTADGSTSAESGLTHVSPFVESDGTVRYVYGGDLLGNLWKFDLVSRTTTKVAVFKDASGNLQPVTAQPELLWYENKRIILVGTGRLLDITDFGSTATQTFYAVSDGATLSNARSSLVQQTYTRSGDSITTNAVDWSTTRGWYLDLPAGEQANTRPVIARGAVSFVTNIAGASDCSASSYLYVLNVVNGQKFPDATFVSTQVSASANSSGLNALLTTDGSSGGSGGGSGGSGGSGTTCQHIVAAGQTSDGTPWKRDLTNCVTITPRKNAWREVRKGS